MNNIYKIIWSTVKQAFVVVSELTKSHGKAKSSQDKRPNVAAQTARVIDNTAATPPPFRLSILTLCVLGVFSSSVYAGITLDTDIEVNDNESVEVGKARAGQQGVAVGDNSQVTANSGTAVGYNSSVVVDGGVALGYQSKAGADKQIGYFSYHGPVEKKTRGRRTWGRCTA